MENQEAKLTQGKPTVLPHSRLYTVSQ